MRHSRRKNSAPDPRCKESSESSGVTTSGDRPGPTAAEKDMSSGETRKARHTSSNQASIVAARGTINLRTESWCHTKIKEGAEADAHVEVPAEVQAEVRTIGNVDAGAAAPAGARIEAHARGLVVDAADADVGATNVGAIDDALAEAYARELVVDAVDAAAVGVGPVAEATEDAQVAAEATIDLVVGAVDPAEGLVVEGLVTEAINELVAVAK